MIKSPRGSIDIIAHSSFNSQVPHNRTNQDTDINNQSHTNVDKLDLSNQLVWTNPIRQSLNPQILRQFAYSDTLLHMAQSIKTPLGVNPFLETGATPPIE